jgi:hypothetical protein
MMAEGLLDAFGGGGSDPSVGRQGLAQRRRGLVGLAVLEVASPDAFQGACFFKR